MKKKLLILILFIATLNNNSQIKTGISDDDTTLVKKFKLNFSVPDIPAFKMLGTSPSDILKPSTPEDISIIASEFISGTSIVLPKSLAVEIAPFMLFSRNLTLQDYDNNEELYSLRLSVGTVHDTSDNTTKLSIGARISVIDKGDLKNDQSFRYQLYNLTRKIVAQKDKYQDEFLNINNLTIQDIVSDTIKNERMEDYIKSKIKASYDDSLENIKKKYKAMNWNKQKLDLAFAVLGQSTDSSAKKLIFKELSFWATYSQPIKDWGQLLIGVNFGYVKDSPKYANYSVSARFYGGINRLKAFTEGQYSYSDKIKAGNLLLNFGSEIGVFDGFWINLSAGIEWKDLKAGNTESNFVSDFDIRFSLPENFPF